jgi:hypothetical protein
VKTLSITTRYATVASGRLAVEIHCGRAISSRVDTLFVNCRAELYAYLCYLGLRCGNKVIHGHIDVAVRFNYCMVPCPALLIPSTSSQDLFISLARTFNDP